jgi:hypothetical protein
LIHENAGEMAGFPELLKSRNFSMQSILAESRGSGILLLAARSDSGPFGRQQSR